MRDQYNEEKGLFGRIGDRLKRRSFKKGLENMDKGKDFGKAMANMSTTDEALRIFEKLIEQERGDELVNFAHLAPRDFHFQKGDYERINAIALKKADLSHLVDLSNAPWNKENGAAFEEAVVKRFGMRGLEEYAEEKGLAVDRVLAYQQRLVEAKAQQQKNEKSLGQAQGQAQNL